MNYVKPKGSNGICRWVKCNEEDAAKIKVKILKVIDTQNKRNNLNEEYYLNDKLNEKGVSEKTNFDISQELYMKFRQFELPNDMVILIVKRID